MTEGTRPESVGRVGDLQVAQDLRFQHRMWLVQRVGWIVFAVLVAAGLAGVLGGGPLSHATARAGDALAVDYDRIARHGADGSIAVTVDASAARDGAVRVWMDRAWLSGLEVRSVSPEPAEVETSADRLTYTFRLAPGAREAAITLDVSPRRLWSRVGRVGLVGGPVVRFRQFVLP